MLEKWLALRNARFSTAIDWSRKSWLISAAMILIGICSVAALSLTLVAARSPGRVEVLATLMTVATIFILVQVQFLRRREERTFILLGIGTMALLILIILMLFRLI